jgi:hypothetical protein
MARVWNRVLALCGVAFVVVTFIGAAIEGSVPHPDASAAAVVKFYASHKTHVEVGTVVMADAVLLILLFAANLRRHLDNDGPAAWPTIIAMTGTVIFAVAGLLEFSSAFIVAHFASKLEPSAALAYNAAGAAGGSISSIGTCALLAGFGIAIIRSRQLPAWLGWVAAALAVVHLAGPAVSNAIEPVVFLWLVLTSIVLAIRTTDDGRAVPTS